MFKTAMAKNKQAVNPAPSIDQISEFYVIKVNLDCS